MAICTAIAVTLSTIVGIEPARYATAGAADLPEIFGVVIALGVPFGAVVGYLLGSLTPKIAMLPPRSRRVRCVGFALLAALMVLPLWPTLAVYLLPITFVHAAWFARATESRHELQLA